VSALRRLGAARRLPKAAKIAVGLVVAALVAALIYIAIPGTPTMTVTAEFSEAPGLFVGNFVEVLGVPVGRITSITPGPNGVAVQMLVPDNVTIPRGAHAVLEAPDVVNDRYVQLMPAYTGGARMTSGTVIPSSRTAIPVTVDQVINSLDVLARVLGPTGANKQGAVSQLIHDLAQTFGHNGSQLHSAILEASGAITGFASHPVALAAALNNLGKLTGAAAANTATYQAFAGDLATVSASLASDNTDVGAALHDLQQALGQLASFVHNNETAIGSSVSNLDAFAAALAAQQKQLANVFDIGPLTLENFTNSVDKSAPGGPALRARYDPTGGSMNLVRKVCGNPLLRGLVLATNPKQRTELDLDCLLNYSLGSLHVPPGASSGPDLSLSHLLAGSGG
jgi:phospholipid/cholesterol/gamma-HCH transport system substrate-binding protein